MSTYLKNMGTWKHSQLKSKSYEEIERLFEIEMKRVNAFIPMDQEEESSKKDKAESKFKRAGEELESDVSKKQKTDEQVEVEVDDTTELKRCLEVVPEDEDDVTVDATPLSSRQMFKNFNRDDLEDLWKIFKSRFMKKDLVDDMDNILLRTLNSMFEPQVEDTIWTYQQGLTKVKNWKLYDSCGVYCITMQNIVYYLLVEKTYPLTRNTLHQLWNDVRLQVDYEVEMAYELLSTNSIYTPLTLMAGHILHFHIEAEIRKGFRFKSLIRVRNRTNIGFGFALNTSDTSCWLDLIIYDSKTVDWEVEVYAWSARVWKSVSNIPPAFKYSYLESGQVYVGGFIYFGALDYRLLGKITSNLIVSFDLKSNEFGEVCLPDRLVNTYNLGVMKVYESLGLLEHNQYDDDILSCGVWVMKEGVSKMFTKMFSIKTPFNLFGYTVVELRKNGDAILKDGDYMFEDDIVPVLKVYETCSGHINDFGIKGKYFSFSVKSYMETLLLLDHSDSGHSLTMMQRMLGLYGHSPGVIFLMINMVIYAELMQDLNFSCVSQTKSCQIGPMID
ncbi:retrovirus-related pol polyprotein from transposon TNT 1-94 [Tanacetum coccineum]